MVPTTSEASLSASADNPPCFSFDHHPGDVDRPPALDILDRSVQVAGDVLRWGGPELAQVAADHVVPRRGGAIGLNRGTGRSTGDEVPASSSSPARSAARPNGTSDRSVE